MHVGVSQTVGYAPLYLPHELKYYLATKNILYFKRAKQDNPTRFFSLYNQLYLI